MFGYVARYIGVYKALYTVHPSLLDTHFIVLVKHPRGWFV